VKRATFERFNDGASAPYNVTVATTFTTACPRNCYSTCGMRVTLENGRLRAIEAHPGNLATSEGVCLKGLAYLERVSDPERLLHPLQRAAGGRFERVSWDDAFGRIAAELEAVRERYGPRAVLFYQASGTKGLLNRVAMDFWRLYGGCTTTYGDLCWPAGLEATRLSLGDNRHSAPWDLVNARLIIFWGKNPAETNIHQMRFVEQAVDRGARVIVVDPRRTQSAEGAELLVQVRPGTDGALALGIAHLLIAEDRVNSSFIERHVRGYPEFAAMVRDWPPERVAGITDVPEPVIGDLAELIGSISPLTICAGFGMQRYTNSAQTMRALIALLALTGNFGRPGAGWVYANLQSHIFDAVRDPLALYPPAADSDPVRVSVPTARLGPVMLEQRDPPLKAAWVERGNPVTQNPQTGAVLEAFRALDFRVVVDQFLTDTAREADLVLPAKTMFEQTDVINAYWHPYIQIKDKLLEPPGEVKPESEIYRELAHRLGFPANAIAARLPAPSDPAVEAWLEHQLQPFPGLSLARLREGPVLAPGAEEVAWSDLRFATPSGRIELASEEAAARWGAHPLPVYTPPQESPSNGADPRFPLHLLTPNTKNRIHTQFGNLPSIRALDPRPVLQLSPVDARTRGIADGDRVCVFNDRGSLELEAAIDHSLRPGCVVTHNGWWRSEGGGINLLSAARETDMGHGAAFHDNAVEVERRP
jgi:anaerobic selenocysteine-containing dehydrogenase